MQCVCARLRRRACVTSLTRAGRRRWPAAAILRAPMLAWVPSYLDAGELAEATGVDVRTYPDAPLDDPALAQVELLVPPPEAPTLRDAVPRMSSLRVIQTDSAGFEWIEELVPAGVALHNARGVHDVPVAEWVVAAVLAMIRRLPEALEQQARGEWRDWDSPELCGATAVIVGHGSAGEVVAERLRAFGAQVVPVARTAREGVLGTEDLPEALGSADVVILLVPLTEETRGLADAEFLARIPDGGLLVNAARGGVVDTGALLAELRAGRLTAALDVTDPEPLPAEHELWRAPGVLITPHVAGRSVRRVERTARLLAEQLRRYARGEELLNRVG